MPQLGEGPGGGAPWRDREKRVIIDEFPIYVRQFLKLHAFAAILRNENFKKFQGFFFPDTLGLGPPKNQFAQLRYCTCIYCLY